MSLRLMEFEISTDEQTLAINFLKKNKMIDSPNMHFLVLILRMRETQQPQCWKKTAIYS